jgi:uncharacterized protein (TIGR00730 family)
VRVSPAVTVFLGAHLGNHPEYGMAAREVGRIIAGLGLELVYGGARGGLMGMLAGAALLAGGRVVGVLPPVDGYEAELPGLSERVVCATLGERKREMIARADAFVILPGGIGTLDELFEVAVLGETFAQHTRPSYLVDVRGYWRHLLAWRAHAESTGFVKSSPLAPRLIGVHRLRRTLAVDLELERAA